MTESELKMVADHMGHNLNVHTDIYRLQSSLLEKTKVARVLIAAENSQIGKFQGCQLDSVSINDMPEPIDYEDSSGNDQVQDKNSDIEEEAGVAVIEEEAGGAALYTVTELETDIETDKHRDISTDYTGGKGTKRKLDTENVHKIQRLRWTEEDNKIFREILHHEISNKTMPPGSRVRLLAEKLPGRTAAQIRTKIHNIISGKLKKF